MLTEREIEFIIQDHEVLDRVKQLKKDFRSKEAPYLEISDHDFLSLVMLMPSVLVALANKEITLKEEIELNKKARKASKGNFFLKKDPVVAAMGFLIKGYQHWEAPFLDLIRFVISKTVNFGELVDEGTDITLMSIRDFEMRVANAPYLYVRLISSFFRTDEKEDLDAQMTVSTIELNTMKDIGEKLGFDKTPIFRKFLSVINVKD